MLLFLNRHVNINVRFGNDLSDALQVLDEEGFTIPASLTELERIWAEYSLAQKNIQTCENVVGPEFFSLKVLFVDYKGISFGKDCGYYSDTLHEIFKFYSIFILIF